MKAIRQGMAVGLMSVLAAIIGVNASYFALAFPGEVEATGSRQSLAHLPHQRDAYRPPPPPGFLTSLTARSVAVTLESAAAPAPLLRYRANDVVPLASLTKLMSALVMLDHRPDWHTVVTVRSEDYRGGTKPRIVVGNTLTTEDLWHLMLVGSDNDATAAMVRTLGFSEVDFTAEMNRRAAALGLTSTHFVEPTGLAAGNVSTAREFAVIARTAFAEPRIAETLALQRVTVTVFGVPEAVLSTDQQLKTFRISSERPWEFATGKTGYIAESGYNVALVIRNQEHQRLLAVVLGSRSLEDRTQETEQLLRWATAAVAEPGAPPASTRE